MKNKHVLVRLLLFIKPYYLELFGIIVSSLIHIISTLLTPVLIGRAIDTLIGVNQVDFDKLFQYFLYIGITVLCSAIGNYVVVRLSNNMTFEILKDLRMQLFEKYHHLELSYIDSHPHGDLMSRMIADIDLIGDGLLQGFTNLFGGIVTIIGTLVFMLNINVAVAMIVVILTPLSLVVSSIIARKTYRFFQEQLSIRGELSGFCEEMIGHQKIVKAFQHEDDNIETFEEINARLFKSGVKSQFLGALINPTTRVINAIVYGSVCLFGAYYVLQGNMTVGILSSFLTYANQYTKPFNDISTIFTELESALACADRVFQVLDEPDIQEVDNPIEVQEVQGHIDIDHIYFSYNKNHPLIEDFNLQVEPGQTIAIVGPTGCGKTTFINLLMRFYNPDSGTISIDNIPINNMTRKNVRHLYGMVLQDTWLFKGSIRDNIAYGREDATEEDIIEAAKQAHAHKFIMQLKDNYGFILSEEGSNLSQGQRQLLSIARIMLAKPDMLILDEATSSIDTRTERQIQDAFDHMMASRTTFIVAHRLSTIQKADQIIVMKDGHIIESGNHQTLLEKQGFYHELYYSQFDTQN